MPLPQPRPAELTPPQGDGKAKDGESGGARPAPEAVGPAPPSACLAAFASRGGVALPPGPASAAEGCAVEDPVTFRSIAMPDGSKVEMDSAVTVSCAFALEVLGWVRDDLPASLAGAKPARLTGVGGHACRPRNGVAGAFLSEHASGNALDLVGVRLSDGRVIRLTDLDGATRPLREAIQKSACARFATVLGPGSDGSHSDHIHLDMRKRQRGYKICQWAME